MTDMNSNSLVKKLQNLEALLKRHHDREVGYGMALREAIISMDPLIEVEVLKSLGDLHLEKGKLRKESAEFDKAAALYAAALLRCTDPDMGHTVQHRIGYMEKLSKQLPNGYAPQYQWLSPDYWGTADSNILRVAEICDKLDRRVGRPWHSIEEIYTETLVTAIANGDRTLEAEALKSLGDFYLKKVHYKKTPDFSQFSKAVAMYKRALSVLAGTEALQALQHRVLYMVKIWGAVRRKRSSMKPRRGVKRPNMVQLLPNLLQPGGTQDNLDILSKKRKTELTGVAGGPSDSTEERIQNSQYKDHVKKGDLSLTKADLDSAEQHFSAALKMVHVKYPTAQQYQREVEPLYKLGDVYSKRGQQTGDGGDFVKAAALYNAAIARSEDQVLNGNMVTAIKEIEMSFLACILGISCTMNQDNIKAHKKQLKEMRDQIKLEMETIDQQLDPYVHDEDDPRVKEIEAKRAQAVRQLFEKIAQQRKEFISLLVEECIGLMGPLPCTYALVGLGSQATGLVTPYSDLEFAILAEEESEQCLQYFRNLTHYIHLKVVNLGETILPALGIKSLNDFYSENPLDNWYYDSVTPRGFAFDGSMPKASKTPLGRQGTRNEPSSELICTPSNMASKLQTDVTLYLKEGYHLGSILRNPCLITGDQELIDVYKITTAKILQENGGKMAQQLAQETMKENIKMSSDGETITAKLIDVKKKLYRFPAVAVDCLALASGIVPTTVWKTIEEIKKQQVISPNNAHHLTVLTSISAELRLRTYIANGGQKVNLSALASKETVLIAQKSYQQTNDEVQTDALKPVFHIPDEKQLFRYYYTEIPLQKALAECKLYGKRPALQNSSDLYDTSPKVRGNMYSALCKDKSAIACYYEALENAKTDLDKIQSFFDLGGAFYKMGDYKKAIFEQALRIYKSQRQERLYFYFANDLGDNLDVLLNDLGLAYHGLGDYRKAISYFEESLDMKRNVNDQDTENNGIATTCNNLGEAFRVLGDFTKAIDYYEQALQIKRSVYGQSTAHPEIAKLYNNLGLAYHEMGDCKKAISYFEQALQMDRIVYGQTTVYPDIAKLLNNLGSAWGSVKLNDNRKAITYHEEALQMGRCIYGESAAHPIIAYSLNNLGYAWIKLGDPRKSLRYHEQALLMRKSMYGRTAKHPDIAESLNNVGSACTKLGDHRKAKSYYEDAVQMCQSVYGVSTAHPQIAASLDNMGIAWGDLGEPQKALRYHEQALEMRKSIYGQTYTHYYIAASLNNVGVTWNDLGDFRKAKSYLEKALEMFRSIGYSPTHPKIKDLEMALFMNSRPLN